MMDRTDRHFRYLMRLLAPSCWLYTEMITTGAVLEGATERLLAYDPSEHPVGLQLGGSDARALAAAARIGADWGYDEINLNVGCPSGRVQAGCFGAALMANPALVAECVQAMRDASGLPVTVKTRLGIDDLDSYSHLCEFVAAVAAAGCRTVFVHARKAWLSGLSPKENRDIPPLDYKRVHRLKQDFPELEIVINGGLGAVDTATAQLEHVDGVMLGRAVYRDPYLFAALDAQLFNGVLPSRAAVLEAMLRYAASEVAKATPLRAITRHLMGLYAGLPGARGWRRTLGELDDGVGGLRQLEQTVVERLVA